MNEELAKKKQEREDESAFYRALFRQVRAMFHCFSLFFTAFHRFSLFFTVSFCMFHLFSLFFGSARTR